MEKLNESDIELRISLELRTIGNRDGCNSMRISHSINIIFFDQLCELALSIHWNHCCAHFALNPLAIVTFLYEILHIWFEPSMLLAQMTLILTMSTVAFINIFHLRLHSSRCIGVGIALCMLSTNEAGKRHSMCACTLSVSYSL